MKILFMGTPDFAAEALDALNACGEHEIVGVYTRAPKPKGRGMELSPSPVGALAEKLGLPVSTPATLRDEAVFAATKALGADVFVVAAYGKILPKEYLEAPEYGCVNIHASLLPRWRGAAPIQRCIMAGDEKTGVTTMQMDEGIDTGDMLLQKELPIGENDDCEKIHDALASLGAELILETLRGLERGTVKPTAQPDDPSLTCYADKLTKEDQMLDFTLPAKTVHDRIRALSPFPGAAAVIRNVTGTGAGTSSGSGEKRKNVKLISSRVGEKTGKTGFPGEVLSTENGELTVACGEGTLILTSLTPEGKKRMSAADFINGRGAGVGSVFEKPEAAGR